MSNSTIGNNANKSKAHLSNWRVPEAAQVNRISYCPRNQAIKLAERRKDFRRERGRRSGDKKRRKNK
ncbi:MAG: hypothetical protein BJ554DRAFT_1834 [Olpidium bornovanus]|uniref:Uncharacterized protein n=1 Tax=Olpidium bornovanus TaxID=278681 RepID=A0A8H7ZS19_9FUNG|nr:MAG: hypothetical protein BJ554DRAFT_1834 [Olpidium bornovanus]